MKRVGSPILKEWKIQSYIQPWQPLAPIVECYHHCRLLLQRDVLALHCGEAKICYNTLQNFSKLYLSVSWLIKASTMSYEVLYIEKGGVILDIPLCDSSTYTWLLTFYYWHLVFHFTTCLQYNLHMCPCETKMGLTKPYKTSLRLRQLRED